jgi:hypothetical protein
MAEKRITLKKPCIPFDFCYSLQIIFE